MRNYQLVVSMDGLTEDDAVETNICSKNHFCSRILNTTDSLNISRFSKLFYIAVRYNI